MQKYSTVIVSNRLPVSVKKVDGKLAYEASSGGLATAMASLDVADKIWVGWPGIDSESLTSEDKQAIVDELASRGCYPVFLSKEQMANYYEGYANDTLWPLFHYFQNVARHDEAYWDAYKEVNELFAAATAHVSSETARIWIQDYHFMLLPKLIRERVPAASIGFFLHIPFPSFEIYRLLPERKELLRGLLAADVISFHIYDYGRHFISSCRRLLGASVTGDVIEYDGHAIKIAAHPIGIDYEKFRAQLDSRDTKHSLEQLTNTYHGQKLILSVDRLDYSKGILNRLRAYDLLLREHPEYIGTVKLLMIAVPSRTEVAAYKQLRDDIEMTVSRINGTYGTVNWAPISYQFQNRPFAEIVALYARADIALVTPIRDGMNLVAKEYVASKKRQGGVLILSEMAGAIDEMPEALSVNPNDSRSTLDALLTALAMPKDEQRERIRAMQKRLKSSSVQNWGKEFMEALDHSRDSQAMRFKKLMTPADQRSVVTRFQGAARRLIILDYDGTLKAFTKSPSIKSGTPPLRLRLLLRALVDQPNTTVAIVSGRPRKALQTWFDKGLIELAAEHGAWTRFDRKWRKTDNDFHSAKKTIRQLMDSYAERTAGALVEEKEFSMVWHYINVEPDLAYKRAADLERDLKSELDEEKVAIRHGQNILEVRPASITKGNVVRELLARYPADFVLCAGDDYTDEDMFVALAHHPNAATIKVGSGKTNARLQIEDVPNMLTFLAAMLPGSSYSLALTKLRSRLKKQPKSLIKRVRSALTGEE